MRQKPETARQNIWGYEAIRESLLRGEDAHFIYDGINIVATPPRDSTGQVISIDDPAVHQAASPAKMRSVRGLSNWTWIDVSVTPKVPVGWKSEQGRRNFLACLGYIRRRLDEVERLERKKS